jgi:regulator of RNase E activity RraA
MSSSAETFAALREISTATITTVLLKKGIRNAYMRGPMPLRPDLPRVVGPAFTMRFIPAREDLAVPEAWASPRSTRAAIEDMPEGCVAVADARGVTEAAIFGDILVARMAQRRVTALVTDGTMRDAVGVLATGLPVWCTGAAAPSSVAGHIFTGWQEPIGCGGVAVFPNDIIVADGDGAVVVPAAMADDVAKLAAEQERFENWALGEVLKGLPLPGLYPPNEATRARYEAEKKKL